MVHLLMQEIYVYYRKEVSYLPKCHPKFPGSRYTTHNLEQLYIFHFCQFEHQVVMLHGSTFGIPSGNFDEEKNFSCSIYQMFSVELPYVVNFRSNILLMTGTGVRY